MGPPLQFEFVTSATDHRKLPATRAEVAFVGRSNVGKSSLLNALANRKRLAHVSKTPGRTQLLNLFAIGDGGTAVDCPGYGFAAVPGQVRGNWQQMIEGYLLERENLRMILVLVDGEVGPTKLDVQMLDWLEASEAPFAVVATKLDKVKPSRRGHRRKELADACEVEPDDVIWVSAAKDQGIAELRDLVRSWLHAGWEPEGPDDDDDDDEAREPGAAAAPARSSKPAPVDDDDDDDGDWGPSRIEGDGR